MNLSTKELFTVLSMMQTLKGDIAVVSALQNELLDELKEAGTVSDETRLRLLDRSLGRRVWLDKHEPASQHPLGPRHVVLTKDGVVAGKAPTLQDRLEPAFASLLDRVYVEMCSESDEGKEKE